MTANEYLIYGLSILVLLGWGCACVLGKMLEHPYWRNLDE